MSGSDSQAARTARARAVHSVRLTGSKAAVANTRKNPLDLNRRFFMIPISWADRAPSFRSSTVRADRVLDSLMGSPHREGSGGYLLLVEPGGEAVDDFQPLSGEEIAIKAFRVVQVPFQVDRTGDAGVGADDFGEFHLSKDQSIPVR